MGTQTAFTTSGSARICYEIAGDGVPIVFVHAGVADRRQWNDAFTYFGETHAVLRYDMRGFGQSKPVAGSYRSMDDLQAVLTASGTEGPKVMVGCSMGGSLAMDYKLAHPDAVKALVMVCSGPSGLSLDVEAPAKFALVEEAEAAGDWDRVCELETQIWFDGRDREPNEVDASARALLFEMNRLALEHGRLELGERQFDLTPAAYKRLAEIAVPVLIVTGGRDVPFMAAAADVMRSSIPNVQSVDFPDAAHLPNMEEPLRFNAEIERFLQALE